jgi:uncharacterized membrane protein
MSAERRLLLLSLLTGVLWLVGAFFMQSAVDDHMNYALAALLSFGIGVVVLGAAFVGAFPTMMAFSMFFATVFAVVAVALAVIEWDWRALVAAVAYGVASVLSFVVFSGIARTQPAKATPIGESNTNDGGRRRLIPGYRRHRRSTADQGPDGG